MIRKFKGYTPPPVYEQSVGEVSVDPLDELKKQLAGQSFEQLTVYAKENVIDLGNVTTAPGALKKIYAHLEAKQQPTEQ